MGAEPGQPSYTFPNSFEVWTSEWRNARPIQSKYSRHIGTVTRTIRAADLANSQKFESARIETEFDPLTPSSVQKFRWNIGDVFKWWRMHPKDDYGVASRWRNRLRLIRRRYVDATRLDISEPANVQLGYSEHVLIWCVRVYFSVFVFVLLVSSLCRTFCEWL